MKLLVAYDIGDDRRRQHAVRILLDYGQRVQESVFWLEAESELIELMRQRIRAIIDPEIDSVWILFLCEACIGKLEAIGIQNVPSVPAFYII
jgi:CRISPR-associated protein Cas2